MKTRRRSPSSTNGSARSRNWQLQATSERKYYQDQAGPLASILKVLAQAVSFVMAIGAVFGAMNTMYAIVAARTREIGTLRALGFARRAILFSFVIESVFLALLGGAIGCLLAFPMNGFSSGTGQTQSFSEIAFAFRITPQILVSAMVFAGLMGLIGGLLPSFGRHACRSPPPCARRSRRESFGPACASGYNLHACAVSGAVARFLSRSR
jgi:putative ABC transport system permease protein